MKKYEELTQEEKFANNGFEVAKHIVEVGDSKVFNNWHEHEGITMEDFISGLEWVCGDKFDEHNRLTRELGCKDGKLYRLNRVYTGSVLSFRYEDGRLWETSLSVPTAEYNEKWGHVHRNACSSISCRDRI